MSKEKRAPDPSKNVQQTVTAATAHISDNIVAEVRRIDALFEAEKQRANDLRDAERRRVDEKMNIAAENSVQLNVAEAKRIDAIRAVDVNAVSVANERATAQAAVLANQVAASAETLRALVAATAATQAQQLAQLTNQLTDRLASLEKSQYEKQGSSGGARDMWGYVFGIGVAVVMAGLGVWAAIKP